jgi:hypothetical protein
MQSGSGGGSRGLSLADSGAGTWVPSPGVKRAINGGLAVLLGVLECLLGFLGQDAIGEGVKWIFQWGGPPPENMATGVYTF